MHCARVYKPEIKGAPKRREFIDPSHCRHLRKPKPKRTHKPCKVGCKWSVSNWTQCPADCSEEYQSRSVYCESVFGKPINHTYCDAANKPPVKKICNNCVKREYKTMSSVRVIHFKYFFVVILSFSLFQHQHYNCCPELALEERKFSCPCLIGYTKIFVARFKNCCIRYTINTVNQIIKIKSGMPS